ncbi:MAG: VWA domain-containing protein [Bryobacteraceae bacterium]
MKRSLLAYLVSALAGIAGASQVAKDEFVIKTNADLVILDVAVEDRNGTHVANLTKERFEIREDGKIQNVRYFSQEDLPVAVGLVVDQSGSMTTKRRVVVNSARSFVESSNPSDEMFVVNFNDRARLGLPHGVSFSSNVLALQLAISAASAEGRTSLNDAIVMALEHVRKSDRIRKVILVVSDGGDNASHASEKQMMDRVAETPVTIYTVGIFEPDDPDKNPGLLRRLSRLSGGEAYLPESVGDIANLMAHIGKEIRSRYTLAYAPSRSGEAGERRKIQVHVNGQEGHKLVVRARTAYQLPEMEAAK